MKIDSIRKKLTSIFFPLSALILYGGLVLIDNNHCPSKKLYCKIATPASYPAKSIYRGFLDLNVLSKFRTTSGMVSDKYTTSLDKVFDKINPGFTFNFEKGSRNSSGFLLLSKSNPEQNGTPQIELWDINNQNLVKKWNLQKAVKLVTEKSKRTSFYFLHPLVFSDGSLVFNSQRGGGYLIKVNKDGDVLTLKDDFGYHHSLNVDSKGLIYAAITDRTTNKQGFNILDKNLKLISTFYIYDIYKEHNLLPRLFSSNAEDPVHLNDIEPLLKKDGSQSDIVFISLRSPASIITYDLKNKKIINIFDSFTSQQHDVDIMENSNSYKLSIFDNNVIRDSSLAYGKRTDGNKIVIFDEVQLDESNYIDIYSPNSNSFLLSNIEKSEITFDEILEQPRPKTIQSGLSEYNSKLNTFIIEESSYGRIFEFNPKTNKVLWTYLNADKNKNNYWRLSWSRFYEQNPLI